MCVCVCERACVCVRACVWREIERGGRKGKTILYGMMTEVLVIREITIDEAAGRGDSDSRMTSFEVIIPLKL